jgi:hypothetical protein
VNLRSARHSCISLIVFTALFALLLGGCKAPPPSGPPTMQEGVAAPSTPVPPAATPNVVATAEAVATVVREEDATAAAEAAAATAAEDSGGISDLPPEITTHLWRLDQYADAAGEMVQALPNVPVTAQWSNGMLRGETGCSAYNGAYVMQDNQTITVEQLRLSALGLGNLGCDKESPEVNQEGIYIGNLYKTAIYAVKEAGRLEVADGDGKLLLTFVTND